MSKNNEVKLTARDYYKANDPEYLKEHPEQMKALKKIQSNCKPTWCGMCYFCKQKFDDKLYFQGLTCALDLTVECPMYEGRAENCPL